MKILLIFLAFMPIMAIAQTDEAINYWDNRKPKNTTKTAGSQLKGAGKAFYLGAALSFAGATISYLGNQSIKSQQEQNLTTDYSGKQKTINTVSNVFYGASFACTLVAFGKLISAGNLMDEERKQAQKNTSLNFTGNGVSLVYKF
ncbi:MAG: hypothetical protein WCX31_04530 [Salinivirgaceae bacterium]